MQSQYANAVPAILADMEKEREDENPQQPTQDDQGNGEKVVYVYPLEGGGVVFTETPLEEDEPAAPIVESQEPETDTRPTHRKDPLYFLHVLLLLFLFVGLDNVETFLTPTVTVTITPQVKTISTAATVSIGAEEANVRGRVVAPLTIAQTQTVNATGKGHQDARVATGTLIFYNGSFASQTVSAGTVYTGSDGVQVNTNQTVTIPAANPPYVGQATVPAHAILAGANGNIQNGDITITGNTLQVRNTQFAGGRDARDFTYVSKADIQGVDTTLIPQLLQSEQAALTAQLGAGESLVTPMCTPRTTTNHVIGDEAPNVTVTVSESCRSLTYNTQELQRAGESILAAQRAASLTHYQQVGNIHLSILSQFLSGNGAILNVQVSIVWVYQFDRGHVTALIAGKPRLDALHLITMLPGVGSVSIAGVDDNDPLPPDIAHIHMVFIVLS